jgi:hypothetical protein
VSGIVVGACITLGNRTLPASIFRRLAKIPQRNLDIHSLLHYHPIMQSFAESRSRQANSLAAMKARQHVSYESS